jgi:hypothetical protein
LGIFCGHLEYYTVIWYILLSFGVFFPFWYQEKSGIPVPNNASFGGLNGPQFCLFVVVIVLLRLICFFRVIFQCFRRVGFSRSNSLCLISNEVDPMAEV